MLEQLEIERQLLKTPRDLRMISEQQEIAVIVQQVPFFQKQGLKPAEFLDISINMDYCKLPKNANVVKAGDEGDQFFIVLSGKVSVWVHVSDSEMKKIFDLIKKKIVDQRMPWDDAKFDIEFVSDGRETKNHIL